MGAILTFPLYSGTENKKEACMAYVITKEYGEYSDYRQELLSVALDEKTAVAEVNRHAKDFMAEREHLVNPVELITRDSMTVTIREGVMGFSSQDTHFSANEVPLAQ